MVDVFVDPIVVAAPHPDAAQDVVESYLDNLLANSFFESITEHEIDAEELVLKKILMAATAILTNNTKYLHDKYELRPKRISKTADAPQETRSSDGAKAWRMTVIPEGAGWRMHYWKIPVPEGSIIEFANVLKKHDPEEIY